MAMMKEIVRIKDKKIGNGNKVYVIAEIGMNHNGEFKLAKEHIQAAAECGADAITIEE